MFKLQIGAQSAKPDNQKKKSDMSRARAHTRYEIEGGIERDRQTDRSLTCENMKIMKYEHMKIIIKNHDLFLNKETILPRHAFPVSSLYSFIKVPDLCLIPSINVQPLLIITHS